MAIVTLRAGKERPVIQKHPWIFSGAIAGVDRTVQQGDVVEVHSAQGEWLARGTWSSHSQIRVRLFTWEADEPLDDRLLGRRIERALTARTRLPQSDRHDTDAFRLIFAESDGLPGLIVDRYAGYLACQFLTQGTAARRDAIVRLLAEAAHPQGIYERDDPEMRRKEELPPIEGEHLLWGAPPPAQLTIRQQGQRFPIDLAAGQKTGFYLDQARNRRLVATYCAGAEVLDCFCYTGGFSVWAAAGGAASITAVDSNAAALGMLREAAELNTVSTPIETVVGDVFNILRHYRHEQRRFDVVILDPPKFAHAQGQVERATRGYKDINMIALQLLRPGGILATFSCSGLVSADLFQKVVFGAAIDARRDVQAIERLTQAPDHPVLLSFPESEYLKGLICRVW